MARMPKLIFDQVVCTHLQWATLALPDIPSCSAWALLLCYTQSSNSWDNISWLKYWYCALLFHSRPSLSLRSLANYIGFFTEEIHSQTQVQLLWHTCPFLSPFMPLFLIGFETCWEGRICRQKCLRNCIGSIISIWWTLCGSPEKNSYPSVFSGYLRRDCSLINIISALDSSRSGYEMKQDFDHAVGNKYFPFGTPFQLLVSFFLTSLPRFLQILRGLAGGCHDPVKMCHWARTSALQIRTGAYKREGW